MAAMHNEGKLVVDIVSVLLYGFGRQVTMKDELYRIKRSYFK
jgi:hypothetical protein